MSEVQIKKEELKMLCGVFADFLECAGDSECLTLYGKPRSQLLLLLEGLRSKVHTPE